MLHNFLSLLPRLVTVFLLFSFSLSGQAIDPLLQSVMDTTSESQHIPIFIVLKERFDSSTIEAEIRGMNKYEKRQYVVEALKQHSTVTQKNIVALLLSRMKNGKVSHVSQLWIVNGISCSAVKAVILNLSTFPEVRTIRWDPVIPEEDVLDGVTGATSSELWNIERINAPSVWSQGFTGQGVLIAMLDTGVDYNHPDLADHMWDGSGQFYEYGGNIYELVNHGFDFSSIDNDPMDGHGHGTKTAGIAAGDGTGGTKTGVAPDATIMAVRITPASETRMIEGIQFAIDFGADIVSMSVSKKFKLRCSNNSFVSTPDYPSWRESADNELSVGIFHANSTGNWGHYSECTGQSYYYPIPYNIAAPANCPPPSIHPDQTLVGNTSGVMAVGNTDISDSIYYKSGRGPSAWEDILVNYLGYTYPIPQYSPVDGRLWWDYSWDNGNQIGLIKPDVSAPGEGTTSTKRGGGYSGFGGTSAATPHVGGSAALLLSAFPQLTPKYFSSVLQGTAVDYGPQGKDNRYGAGRIDVYAAYQLVVAPPADVSGLGITEYQNHPKTSWNPNSEADLIGYNVYRKLPSQSWVMIAFVEAPTTYYIDWEIEWGDRLDPLVCYKIKAVDVINIESRHYSNSRCAPFGGIQKTTVTQSDVPDDFALGSNYPNPFNPITEIEYKLPVDSKVEIYIYNVLGKRIRTLVDEQQSASYYSVMWNGNDDSGRSVSSGMYFYRLKALSLEDDKSFSQTRKMVLLR